MCLLLVTKDTLNPDKQKTHSMINLTNERHNQKPNKITKVTFKYIYMTLIYSNTNVTTDDILHILKTKMIVYSKLWYGGCQPDSFTEIRHGDGYFVSMIR